jgi:colanic acid/amylovoran biosynthesis glycosyltransferase
MVRRRTVRVNRRRVEAVRIACVVPEFPRRTETFVVGPVRRLVARGHEVVVLARRPAPADCDDDARRELAGCIREQPPTPRGRIQQVLRGAGLAVRHAPRHPVLVARALDPLRGGRRALSLSLLHAAAPLLDRPSFDVVHCHFGPAGVIGAMLQAIGVLRGPLVVSFYGHDVTRYPRQHGPGVYRRLFARAERVLALDPCMRDRLEALGADPRRLVVHPLGVDCRRMTPPAETPSRPPLRVLSIGRLVEKKGFDDGLRAVARLRAAGHDPHYRIAGAGPLRAELEALAGSLGISDCTELLGAVRHEAIPALIASAHALLVPSRTASDGDEEGTPAVILEAMACGLPVVATRHAGIPYLVEDGVTGSLASEGDPDGLADALARLIEPQVAQRLGLAGRDAALRRFEAGRLVERLEELYRSLRSG